MTFDKFWEIINNAQVSTALVLIAVALFLIVFKIYHEKRI